MSPGTPVLNIGCLAKHDSPAASTTISTYVNMCKARHAAYITRANLGLSHCPLKKYTRPTMARTSETPVRGAKGSMLFMTLPASDHENYPAAISRDTELLQLPSVDYTEASPSSPIMRGDLRGSPRVDAPAGSDRMSTRRSSRDSSAIEPAIEPVVVPMSPGPPDPVQSAASSPSDTSRASVASEAVLASGKRRMLRSHDGESSRAPTADLAIPSLA